MFLVLSPDARRRVCSFLSATDLLRLEQCSHAASETARDGALWMALCRLKFPTMYEAIKAQGAVVPQLVAKPSTAPPGSSGNKRGSGQGRPRFGSTKSNSSNSSDSDRARLQFRTSANEGVPPSTTSADLEFASMERSGKQGKKQRKQRQKPAAEPLTVHSLAGPLEAEESEVARLRLALRGGQDEISRRERQLAVVYAEDTHAVEELTAELDQLRAELSELQDAVASKEEDLMDLHLSCGSLESLDWRRVFALRMLKQRDWARRKGKRQERLEVLQANKALDPNYNKSVRITARQRTCTTCYRRFVVDENTEGACTFHPGQFVHDDQRCICAGAVRRDRPKIDAEMAQYMKKQLQKTHGRLTSNLTFQVRRGLACAFSYTCCRATDAKAPGCTATKHTSHHSK